MQDPSPLVAYLIRYQQALIHIDLHRELFMIPERITGKYQTDGSFILETESPLYRGKLFIREDQPNSFYAVDSFTRIYTHGRDSKCYIVQATDTDIVHNSKESEPLCSAQDTFVIEPGDLVNLTGEAVETSIGIFVANYLFMVYPFGDKIPFLNDEFTTSKLEKKIGIRLLDGRISVQEVKGRYVNVLSLFGGSNEIICANISEKTITIPPLIAKLREQLVRDNREALSAGDASVMSDIEKQLIAAYKKYLEGDSSLHFLLKPKYFNVTLKKLFLTQGMTEVFGSPGKFTFIDQPMGNGWKQENLPDIFNEVRSGSYSRAIETADGGVIAKLILRVFQDTNINIPDCGTKQGESVPATLHNLRDFEWNYIINSDGTETLITDDNISSLVGDKVTIRTPGYCQSPKGYCAKCFGRTFEVLGQKAFAPVANGFSKTITVLALKKMHGTSHSLVDVSNVSKYLI